MEIHSSDYCKHSDCDSDYSRSDLLYGVLIESPAALTVAGDMFSFLEHGKHERNGIGSLALVIREADVSDLSEVNRETVTAPAIR